MSAKVAAAIAKREAKRADARKPKAKKAAPKVDEAPQA
jgi:hypothetical protein